MTLAKKKKQTPFHYLNSWIYFFLYYYYLDIFHDIEITNNKILEANSNWESSVQFSCSVMSDSLWPHGLYHSSLPCSSPTPRAFTKIHVHWVNDAIQPSHPLSSPSPPALNLSQHQVFSSESGLPIRWPKYWSLSFSISPSN